MRLFFVYRYLQAFIDLRQQYIRKLTVIGNMIMRFVPGFRLSVPVIQPNGRPAGFKRPYDIVPP